MLKLQIIGNLGSDAVTRILPNNETVINFNVASTKAWKDKDGQKQERTTWIGCSYFSKSNVYEYLKKGSQVFIEGDPTVRQYKDINGDLVPAMDVTVRSLTLLSSTKDKAPAATSAGNGSSDEAAAPVLTDVQSNELF